MCEAKVLFDYQSEDDIHLQITEGEIVYVLDGEGSGGWSQARNSQGQVGLVPTNYVQIQNRPSVTSNSDESDWEDSDDNTEIDTNVITRQSELKSQPSMSMSISETSKTGTIRMPRWFFRNGGEEFLLGLGKCPPTFEVHIEKLSDNLSDIFIWKPMKINTCEIISHEIKAKYSGIKTYVTYKIQSSYSKDPISRRYNQFDWLYDQLSEKFRCVVIPPVPKKQASGRYKEDFINGRKRQLQKWLYHVIEHPVLGESYAIHLFLSEKDKKKWRSGKRNIEKDELKNGGFFNVVDAPLDDVEWTSFSKRIDKVSNFIDNFEKSARTLQIDYNTFHKKQRNNVFKLYHEMGASLLNLSTSMSLNPNNYKKDIELLHGIQMIGEVYQGIGTLFKDQSYIDGDLVEDNLEEIVGVTKSIVPLLDLSLGTVNTTEATKKKVLESQLNLETLEVIDRNLRVVTKSVDSELNWLQNRRENQLRSTMTQYLKNQINLFTNITKNLSDVLEKF